MPLITPSGKTVSLVRPKDEGPKQRKKSPPKREFITVGSLNLPKQVRKTVSKYKVAKHLTAFYLPPLVVVTFRSYAIAAFPKKTLEDSASEIFMYCLDLQYPGWDSAHGRPLDTIVKQTPEEQTLKSYNIPKFPGRRDTSHYRGPKVYNMMRVPLQIYVAVRSIAEVSNRPISDIFTEFFMQYFDDVLPGWELNGDIEDDPPSP